VRVWLAILAVLIGLGNAFAADSALTLANDKRWEQARQDLAQGKPAEAKAEFEKLLADYPKEPDLYLFISMTQLRLRDPRAAEAAARRAVELNPQHADARTFLAWIEMEVRGDIDAAIGEYKKVVELHPELATAYSNLAVAQKRKGDYAGAIASLDRALALKPDSPVALTTRGGVLAEQERWADAERDFAAALKLNPRDDGAQAALRELLARSPNFVYWLEWGRIGLIRYWWVLLSLAIGLALKGRFKKVRTVANG